MKKIVTGIFAIMMLSGAANAQDSTHRHDMRQKHEMGKQLNLTEDQKAKIKSINEARHNEIQSLNNAALTADQRKEKMKSLHAKYQTQMEAVLTPSQKDQMHSFKNKQGKKGVAKHGDMKGKFQDLNLTQDQKDKMSQLRTDYKGKFEALRDNKSLSDDQRKEQMKSLKQEQQGKMKSILTKEQMDKMQSFRKDKRAKDNTTK